MEKSIVYVCEICRRVCICGTWTKVDERVSRILTLGRNKWLPDYVICTDCQRINTVPSPS